MRHRSSLLNFSHFTDRSIREVALALAWMIKLGNGIGSDRANYIYCLSCRVIFLQKITITNISETNSSVFLYDASGPYFLFLAVFSKIEKF